MIDLSRLQAAMLRADVDGITRELGFGSDAKPRCPICDLALPAPHAHCDSCESPYVLGCTAPGCRGMFCARCMRQHDLSHVWEE